MEPRRGLAEPFACGIAGTQRRECLGSWLLGVGSAFGPANAMWEEEMFGGSHQMGRGSVTETVTRSARMYHLRNRGRADDVGVDGNFASRCLAR